MVAGDRAGSSVIATIYDLLIDRTRSRSPLRRVVLGLNWSVAEAEACGLCYSPTEPPRTLSWPGTLVGRAAADVAAWIKSAEPAEATVGVCVVNAVLNHPENPCALRATPLSDEGPRHLAVFAHFKPVVKGAKVVVVGRYPGLETIWNPEEYACLERRPVAGTLPESAAEQVLSGADWVFVTASAIANGTLPRLLRFGRGAQIVLMGPSLPWLAEWSDFGVHYLAGVVVNDAEELVRVASEGGGTRIFERAVSYRVLSIK